MNTLKLNADHLNNIIRNQIDLFALDQHAIPKFNSVYQDRFRADSGSDHRTVIFDEKLKKHLTKSTRRNLS